MFLYKFVDLLCRARGIVSYSGRFGGKPVLESSYSLSVPNIGKLTIFIFDSYRLNNLAVSLLTLFLSVVYVLQGREISGPLSRREAVPTKFYNKMQLYRHTLGHLSAVYCVLFDRTGKYIITGADDLLVKVWSSIDGRLLATFRGASAEIMDIAVNFDNTLLAAGSLDKILRVWCFQTMSPVNT